MTHLDNIDIIDNIDSIDIIDIVDIREHVVVPLDPLVHDPLVALHHGAAKVLHPLVHLALDSGQSQSSHHDQTLASPVLTLVLMVCQNSAVPSAGGTTRPRLGKTVAPPARTCSTEHCTASPS